MWVWKTNRINSPGQQVAPNEFWSVQDTFCSFQRSTSRLVPGISRLLNFLDCYQSTALCKQSTAQLSGLLPVDYSAGPVDYSAPSVFYSAPSVFCSAHDLHLAISS